MSARWGGGRRPADDRHPCACPCDCDNSAAGELCYLCGEGFHHPSRAVRAVLNANLELWGRLIAGLTPDSSSGISVKALASARAAYAVQADRSNLVPAGRHNGRRRK